MGENDVRAPAVDLTLPNSARMYDYWLGGKDNLEADREAADRSARAVPQLPLLARENRRFLGRAVRYCAAAGVTQFLDIGSGLPTMENVHQVAGRVAAAPRVMYVDNDPVVVSHARAVLSTPHTAAFHGDLTRAGEILDAPEVRDVIDFTEPVAILLVAVLHFIGDEADPYGNVAKLRDAMAPGSHLVISHTDVSRDHVVGREVRSDAGRELKEAVKGTRPANARTREDIVGFFGDLTLVEPGLTDVWRWRPDADPIVPVGDVLTLLGGVARKD